MEGRPPGQVDWVAGEVCGPAAEVSPEVPAEGGQQIVCEI